MILLSSLLVVVACALLGAGVFWGLDLLVVASMLVSLLAAVLLALALRRSAGTRPSSPRHPAAVPPWSHDPPSPGAPYSAVQPPAPLGVHGFSPQEARRTAVDDPTISMPHVSPAFRPVITEEELEQATVVVSTAHGLPPRTPPPVAPSGDTVPSEQATVRFVAETEQETVLITPSTEEKSHPDLEVEPAPEVESPEAESAVEELEEDDLPDEPPAELLISSEETRLTTLDATVIVVDGRPRYHVEGCSHLAEKASQPLPVAEATELGFTPCATCHAATTLLAASG